MVLVVGFVANLDYIQCRDDNDNCCADYRYGKGLEAMTINHIDRVTVEAFRDSNRTVNIYHTIATQNANYPGKGTALGLIYIAGKLGGEAGELSGQVFKAMRDDDLLPVYDATAYDEGHAVETPHSAAHLDHALTPTRRAKVIKEAGDVLWYLAALADELGMSLSEIALGNLENLAGRTERGTLQGDGDDR